MYGGFQANLADPIPAIALVKNFPNYRIMTKRLEIDFIRVGNSDLLLHFDFSAEQRQTIQMELDQKGRADPCFEMHYYREDGEICTVIRNTMAIRPRGYVGNHDRKLDAQQN